MRRRGSITVFTALTLMLVAQLLFTLLEAARHEEFSKVLQMNTDAVLESEFADYCSPLWDTYHLLGMSAEDGSGTFSFNNREAQCQSLTADNLGSKGSVALLSGVSLLSAEMADVEFSSYLLMTDQGGKVFEDVVSAYMKQNIVYEAAKSVYNDYEAVKNVTENYEGSDEAIGNALDSVEQSVSGDSGAVSGGSIKGSGTNTTDQTKTSETATEAEENPLTIVTEAKKSGVLALVLPSSAKLSDSALNLQSVVSHRKLERGTGTYSSAGDWYQKVLVNQYLKSYLSCYTNPHEGRALNYEIEYLLGGKAKDADNLRVVVAELLAIREALNMASLIASPTRQAEALSVASSLVGFTMNPAIIEGVKYGIIAAWAFAESVLDLRTLLAGEKISLIKSDAEWTSNVHSIATVFTGWSQAKSCPQGFSYDRYLGILLFFHSGEKLAMRAMDVEEATVCMESGYENFKMDHVVCKTSISATYEYSPVFLGFVTLLNQKSSGFRIQRTGTYSYITGEEGV